MDKNNPDSSRSDDGDLKPDSEKGEISAEDRLEQAALPETAEKPDGDRLAAPSHRSRETAGSVTPEMPLPDESHRKRIVRAYRHAAEKAAEFPHAPGVYLMKDESGRVIYIGKAKDLRKRTGSYFRKTALDDPRTAPMVAEIRDIDYLACESEVDAILNEARLIKDIRPKYNRDLKDDKSFPYLQITVREEYPRVEITRTPRSKGVRLFGPFPSASHLRGALVVLQKIFRFRTCGLIIRDGDIRRREYRPCLLVSIGQCSAPCAERIPREEYRRNIRRLCEFLNGKKGKLLSDIKREMAEAASERRYERAAVLRDQFQALESLKDRGKIDVHLQPEVFQIDPKRGMLGLQKIFHLDEMPRIIEGMDIAHLSGQQTVASVVRFIDGMPFKPEYRRYRIKTVEGIDDFASMAEVVSRRFASATPENSPPDILLIDGGKGQLHAALKALEHAGSRPKLIISLAKRDEEVYIPGQEEPLCLSRKSWALRLLQSVRDESHRFAQHYHHILRRKSVLGDE